MTPLVFVHGFMGGSDQWVAQAPLGQKRRLITLDLPGFGRNAGMDPLDRIEGFAGWALEELSAQGVERFALLGHSMGGMVVQDMVRQAPARVDRLILYSTGSEGELPGRFETIGTSMARARKDGAEATARRIAATWFLERESATGYPHCADVAARSSLPAILAGLAAMKAWSGTGFLPQIACRTLVVWGDQDRTYAWPQIERLWREIPDARLAVLPDCAHAVHAERPEMFNDLIGHFLPD